MANPSDLSGFTFQLVYEYLDSAGVWQAAAFTTGDGDAGQAKAEQNYQQLMASPAVTDTPAQVRNVKVQYGSTIVWTDWEQAA